MGDLQLSSRQCRGRCAQPHPYPGARSQGRLGLRLDLLAWDEIELVMLHHRADDQRRLHKCEVVADALPGTSTKRIVGVTLTPVAAFRSEAFGVELFWIFPEFRPAVGEVGAKH